MITLPSIFCKNQGKNGRTLNYQVLTSKRSYSILAPLCRIFIFQQIKVEKNGFHNLKDCQISISQILEWWSKFIYFVEFRSKTVNFSGFDIISSACDIGPSLPNFNSSANKHREISTFIIQNDNSRLYILLETEAKWQNTNLSSVEVKSNAENYDPCLPNFIS